MNYNFEISREWWNLIKRFANESADTHRNHRSGGITKRSISQKKSDILQGKVGEVVVKNFFESNGVIGIRLDFENYGAGIWDESDIVISDISISIKSSKLYARWLLIETKDIDRGDIYDYYIFVTVDIPTKEETYLPSGEVKGYIDKETLLSDNPIVKHLRQGEYIPNTRTPLDADNYGVHCDNLFNKEANWILLMNLLIKESKKSSKN